MTQEYRPRQPQDALDSHRIDPITTEEHEDDTETLHVDPQNFKENTDESEEGDQVRVNDVHK